MSAAESHDTQLLKGVLVLLLLCLLDCEESYGYELVRRVRAAGLAHVPEGSIYPALLRLERDGHLAARMVANPNGPPRKYLSLSQSGRRFMEERIRAWQALTAVINPLLTPYNHVVAEVSP